MHVVQFGLLPVDSGVDPEALLDRLTTLTRRSEAVREAGVERVSVVLRFHRHLTVNRNGIDYLFVGDGPGPVWWAWPRHLQAVVGRLHPDIAHVDGLTFPWQTSLLRRLLPRRSPLVVQDHATRPPERPRRLRHLARRATMRDVDAFLFTAAEQAVPWQRAGLIAPSQPVYEVLESSTTIAAVPRAAAAAASGVTGRPAVLWVGRLDQNKDPLTVLSGFDEALQRLPDARLTMIFTTDTLREQVERTVRRSPRLSAAVTLAGRVPHDRMAEYYSAADLFVLGSHHEGSGYALLEALACGVMPAVTDIPSFRRITGDGAAGVLWTTGDASACANAIVQAAARMPAERPRLLAHFERSLSWPAVAREVIAAYGGVQPRLRP